MTGAETWSGGANAEHVCQGVRHAAQQLVPVLAQQPHLQAALSSQCRVQ